MKNLRFILDQMNQNLRFNERWWLAVNILLKDRNGMDLTEAEDIKKRWQEYTEELYKKSSQPRQSKWCDHSPRARHPGM